MRHALFGKRLSRNTKSRKALLNNLASSLFEYGQITTTLTKARFVKPYAEKMISFAKRKSINVHRQLASSLTNKAFSRLIKEIGPGFKARSGGYSSITKLGSRIGDGAPMAKIELLKWQIIEKKQKKVTSPKTSIKGKMKKPNKRIRVAKNEKRKIK